MLRARIQAAIDPADHDRANREIRFALAVRAGA
jgi:hypothetical protein